MADQNETVGKSQEQAGQQIAVPGVVAAAPKAEAPKAAERDWEADLKAAESRASKFEKQAKELAGKHAETDQKLAKLLEVLGGQQKDPVAEINATREAAQKFQSHARRNAIESAVVRVASNEGALDPDDIVNFLRPDDVEFDAETGRVKDIAAVVEKVKSFKQSKPYLFKQETKSEEKGAPLPSKAPTPPTAKTEERLSFLTPEQAWTLPISQVRKSRGVGQAQ